MRVKSFMISEGVRNNDFGIVSRGNRYFSRSVKKEDNNNYSATLTKDLSEMRTHETSGLSTWTIFCVSFGAVAYFFIDQVVSISLAGRIIAKYFMSKEYLN